MKDLVTEKSKDQENYLEKKLTTNLSSTTNITLYNSTKSIAQTK